MPAFNALRLRDFDAGLAQSLGVVAFFTVDTDRKNVIDLVTGTTLNFGASATVVTTPEGPALHFSGAQQFSFDHPAVSGAIGAVYITAARIRPTAQQAALPGQIFGIAGKATANQWSYGVGWDNSATPKVGGTVLNSVAASMGASITAALNKFNTVFSRGDVNFTPPVWVDGLSIGVGTSVSAAVVNPDTITFGAQTRTAGALRFATGDLLWAALIKRPSYTAASGVPTDGEMWQHYANDFPNNLFRRARRPFVVAGAGGVVLSRYYYNQHIARAV